MEDGGLDKATPRIIVVNNIGFVVRQLAYYRREAKKLAEVRINLQRYNDIGQVTHLIDPRLSEDYLQDPSSTVPNQSQINTLSGAVLQSKNIDAGMRISISDVRGLSLWSNDSLGNERTFVYDTLGRVTRIFEKTPGKKVLCCDHFVYGDKTSQAVNGAGRLLKHYDTAGLREIKNYSVLGSILNESRQFLSTTTNVDWPEDFTERQKWLATEGYTTQWEYNGLGETLRQTDAKGNQQSTQYGIAGELLSSSLQLKEGIEQPIITKQTYNAAGQLLEKHLSNGVVINYGYEKKTQRLRRLHSVRLSDNKSLQDLNYHYDPVGNILEIIDKAQAPDFYANEKTEAVSQYHYDSLYQLIEASGIESQQAGKESITQNPVLSLGNADASRCVNYTRNYTYDTGGNLYEIQHHGAQRYTRNLQIAADSNRGIEKRDNGPSLVESFDANGNLLYLNAEQPLQWDSRNQLKQVVQLKRETHSDIESYRYDGSGQRMEKLTQRLAQGQIHSDSVRYLPGLELRTHWQTDTQGNNQQVSEQLQVIQSDGVRVLHWETGKPDDIENDGLRYSLTDQLGSTQLELNAKGEIISYESYYPYGGTAIWATKNAIETHYKFIHYSDKEQDATGLYYYGYRYYLPWLGRWLNPDPSGIFDGLNLYRIARNNPITFIDEKGEQSKEDTFKRLYPEQKYDAELKKMYRPIRKIFDIFEEDIETVDVNIRVFELGVPDNQKAFYLFRGLVQKKRLVIDTHAIFDPEVSENVIYLKPDTPTIITLGPEGQELVSLNSLPNQIYATISHEGICLWSEQAKLAFQKEGHRNVTGTTEKAAVLNYTLEKFETFPTVGYAAHRFEQIAVDMTLSDEADILVARKSRNKNRFTVKEVLLIAQELGYEEVVFNFCRTHGQANPKEYKARDTTPLSKPIFKPWSDLKRSRPAEPSPQKRRKAE
jgi:insecticidal toxin complex protein TccC